MPTRYSTRRTVSRLASVACGLTVAACSRGNPTQPELPAPVISAVVQTDGVDLDLNGYQVAFDGIARPVDVNSSHEFSTTAGRHTLELSGIASNCSAVGPASSTKDVVNGDKLVVTFHVTCALRKVAFSSDRSGASHIWTMNRDGTGLVELTKGASETPAGWSSDGAKLTYTGIIAGHRQVFVVNADGSNVRQLTTSVGDNRGGTWSPDGQRIVFTSSRDGNDEVYMMNADGSNQTRITTTPGTEDAPQWSPDGTMIAYTYFSDAFFYSGAFYSGPDFEIRVMNADGSNVRQPFRSISGVRRSASWSLDSKRLVMVQRSMLEKRPFELCVAALTADHCDIVPTSDTQDAEVPRWSPDGVSISYSRRIGLADELHIIGADNVDRRMLPTSTSGDYYVVWRP